MIDIVLKLSFIDNMIDLLANTLNSAVITNLSNNVLVILTLAKGQTLIDWFTTIGNNILKLEWTKLSPFFLNSFKSDTGLIIFLFSIFIWRKVIKLLSRIHWGPLIVFIICPAAAVLPRR